MACSRRESVNLRRPAGGIPHKAVSREFQAGRTSTTWRYDQVQHHGRGAKGVLIVKRQKSTGATNVRFLIAFDRYLCHNRRDDVRTVGTGIRAPAPDRR